MKSQGDGAIHFVNLSNLLTRLRRKSPLAEGEGGERGGERGGGRERGRGKGEGEGEGGRGDIHRQQYLAKFFQHFLLSLYLL